MTTTINLTLGLFSIFRMAVKKVLNGNLVIANMNILFAKYLKGLKEKQTGKVLSLNNEIEFWPKMIESLYLFLLENEKYGEIIFAKKVIFRGDAEMYLKAIEFSE